MQYEITDKAAIELSRAFYEALAGGMPVDAAVAEARKAIRLAVTNTVEWGTPVLYMRAPDGRLFDIDPRSSPPPPLPSPKTLWKKILTVSAMLLILTGSILLIRQSWDRVPVADMMKLTSLSAFIERSDTMDPLVTQAITSTAPLTPSTDHLATAQITQSLEGLPPATRTATATMVPSLTITRTQTPTHTPSPTPTATVTPTSPTGELSTNKAVVTAQNARFRSGPGIAYPPMATLVRGTELEVLGRNADGSWLHLRAPDGGLGWMSASLLDVNTDVATLPIETAPPPPSPTATKAIPSTATPTPIVLQPTPTPIPQPTPPPTSLPASPTSIPPTATPAPPEDPTSTPAPP